MKIKYRAAQQLFQQNELSRALDVLNEQSDTPNVVFDTTMNAFQKMQLI